MSKQNDSLRIVDGPDRVHYETGVLLNAEDFIAEQNYHRGRLARALGYINGSGTLAGLEVSHEAEIAASESDPGRAERVLIDAGLAIDRLGRLIEVSHPLCLRINHWFEQQDEAVLDNAWHDVIDLWPGAVTGVVVDVFIRFAACERGKTPSFAVGPFDSIDAVTAARLRDGYETELILRTETKPKTPENPWTDFFALPEADRAGALRDEIFGAWRETSEFYDLSGLVPEAEHVVGQDTTSLFLARMLIPADKVAEGISPTRRLDEDILIRNDYRTFVITSNALARMLGVNISESPELA